MTALLLILFAVALSVTFTGLFLSSRNSQPPDDQRGVSYAIRAGNTRRVYGARNVRMSQSMARYGRREVVAQRTSIMALLNVKSLFEPGLRKQTPWLGILCILIAVFGIGLFSMNALFPHIGLIETASWPEQAPATPMPTAAPPQNSAAFLLSTTSGASKALVRLGQLDPNQYASTAEYNKWAYSACSAASMTEVINSYGHHYRITDILNVEANIGEITPELGLVETSGIDHTVAKFGFKTVPIADKSLNNLIAIANNGRPVIVDFPPDRWDGGHILVLRGGDSNNVYLADSSRLNMTVMARSTFTKYWAGYAVVAVPNNS